MPRRARTGGADVCGRTIARSTVFTVSFLALALTLAFGGLANAAFLRVPDEFATIQEAIDSAAQGDTVAVRSDGTGSYTERIVVDKEVVLLGGWNESFTSRDPETYETVIDAQATEADPGQPVRFSSGVGAAAVIDGFKLTGGFAGLSTGFRGGGIYCDGASPTITGNEVFGNRAHLGAGIECRNGSNGLISGNYIHDNIEITQSGLQGCGITCERSSPTITGNEISFNKGSGIKLDEAAPLIENNDIQSNTHGAGISCQDGSNATIRNNTIRLNRATFGGGIWIEDSSPIVENNLIEKNQIRVVEGEGGGAGLSCLGDTGNPVIRNNRFIENSTTADGGAIIVKGSTSPTIENNLFKMNSTGGGGGAIVVQENASATIMGNTFYRNVAGRGSSILVRHNASATIQKNIVYGATKGGGVWVDPPASTTLDCNCLSNNFPSDYVGVSPAVTDILMNPIFCRTDGDTLDLAFNSPCLPENNSCGLIGGLP